MSIKPYYDDHAHLETIEAARFDTDHMARIEALPLEAYHRCDLLTQEQRHTKRLDERA